MVLQGDAGSGKTSLLRAGVLPVLTAPGHRPRFRRVGPFRPGADPQAALARAQAEAGGDAADALLLLVDQAEDLFTLCDEAARNAFGQALAALLQGQPAHRVVLLLREAYSARLARIEALRPWLDLHARFSMNERPMGYDDLKSACEGPAADANLHFHAGVVDDMVKQVLGRSTALPLLQFALAQLWQHRERNRITWRSYDAIGRSPLAAVQAFGDRFYAALPGEAERDAAAFVLRKLVHIGEMMDAQRQPVPRAAAARRRPGRHRGPR